MYAKLKHPIQKRYRTRGHSGPCPKIFYEQPLPPLFRTLSLIRLKFDVQISEIWPFLRIVANDKAKAIGTDNPTSDEDTTVESGNTEPPRRKRAGYKHQSASPRTTSTL